MDRHHKSSDAIGTGTLHGPGQASIPCCQDGTQAADRPAMGRRGKMNLPDIRFYGSTVTLQFARLGCQRKHVGSGVAGNI